MDKIDKIILNRFGSAELYKFQKLNSVFKNRDKKAIITLRDIKMAGGNHDLIKNQLRMMHDGIKSCVLCPMGRHLHKVNNMEIDPHVFSNLNSKAKIMLVAQNPGFQECVRNAPLVGDSGMNLDKVLKEHGLSRDLFYITNVVKCKTSGNRPLRSDEVENCISWLDIEIKLLKPIFVVTLGAFAFEVFFEGLLLSDNVNKILKYNYNKNLKFRVLPTFHPSPKNMMDINRKQEFDKTFSILSLLVNKLKEEDVL